MEIQNQTVEKIQIKNGNEYLANISVGNMVDNVRIEKINLTVIDDILNINVVGIKQIPIKTIDVDIKII